MIHYERDVTAADTWLSIGQGVSKNEGAGSGHFGEADYQHIDYIRDTLLHYNYTSIHRDYQNVQGVSSSAAIISQHINEGVSIINYCNHGSPTSWGVFNYSNSHINALTNDNKLPFIWSVACNNGQLDYSQPCFAEAWMRATNNSTGAPTGAIGGMFSYISQPWQPPMYGQDEMNNVLTEHRSIKRTLGGISTDGNMKILDQYNSNGQGLATYQFWLLFGDPTLTVRNMTPANMNVTHASSMSTSATSFTVNATNGNGALATLTRNNEIMGSATINNGTCNITFAAPGTTGTATLTVFGYNKITYIATIQITGGGTQQYTVNVSANPTIGGSVTGGGTYNQGQSCTVTATPNAGYTFTNWTENGNVVSSQANYTFTVNANRTLVANFQAQPQNYNITVSANPSNGGSVARGGTYQQGQSCTVTATANTGLHLHQLDRERQCGLHQANYTFTVNGNRTLVANFTRKQYTITATAYPVNGGNVTGGGTFNYGNSCTLSATPAAGYTFVNWTKNGSQVSTNATYTFTVTESAAYVAHFQLQSFTVNVMADPAEGGTVAGGGTFNYGETCTVTATANEGYTFVNWMQGLFSVSEEATYTFTVTNNVNLTANFALQTFKVKVSVNPAEAGNVTGEGTYNYGDEVSLTFHRNEDCAFQNWTENGEVVSEEMTYTFTITSDRDLDANFIYTEGIIENNIAAKVYPNPTKGEITPDGERINHVRIVNGFGQTVYNSQD